MPQRRIPARDIDSESRKPRFKRSDKVQTLPDDETHISDQSDSEVEQILDMDVKDDSRRTQFVPHKSTTSKKTFTTQQKDSQQGKESAAPETSVSQAIHMIMYSAVYHLRIAPLTYPGTSTYIPSFYMFYEALNAAHRCLNGNTYLKYIAPDYLSVASSLYYAYLGYIHILRSKSTVGIASKAESQCLRKFEREFPFESLPVMSPLIMFFQNLGAIKLPDPMYGWICPTLPEVIGTEPNKPGIFTTDSSICLPNAPALLRFLFELGSVTTVEEVTHATELVLIPASLKAGNQNFFAIDLGQARYTNPDYQRIIYSAGMLAPPEIPGQLDITNLQRIRRWNLPNITSATDLRTIGQFLQTDGNFEWFKNLVKLAAIEAKFFKGSTHFGTLGDRKSVV